MKLLRHVSAIFNRLFLYPMKRRKLKQFNIKLPTSIFAKEISLRLEEGASVAQVVIVSPRLTIGAGSYIRSGCELLNVREIGRYCSIGNGVVIGQERTGHPLDWVSTHPFQHTDDSKSFSQHREPTVIGHDVWIGREAIIMEGVTLGTGCVVGARAVVTKNVPPFAIVAGVPARVIRMRHSDSVIAALLSSQWWEMPVAVLRELPTHSPTEFIQQIRQPPCATTFPYRAVVIENGILTNVA